MGNIKKLLHGSFIVLFCNILAGFLNYFIRRTLAINLSVSDFGFLYAAMSLTGLFLSYIDLGLTGSATILIAKEYNSNNFDKANIYFNLIFYFKLIVSIIILAFVIITYKFWLYDFLKYNKLLPFLILMSMIVIQAISGTPCAALNALQKFTLQSIPNILTPLLILIIIISFGENKLLVASTAFPVTSLITFLIFVFIIYLNSFKLNFSSLVKFKEIKDLFHFSKWIAISTAGFYTLFYMDSLMLTWLNGLKAVGIYNVILPIVQIAISLLVFATVFTPIATQLWVENEHEEIAEICNFMTYLSSYIILPVIITIIYIAKPLIIFLFSSKYISGSNALVILFSSTIFLGLANFYAAVLNTGNEEKKVALYLIITTILNTILNLVLIPLFGISGAALSTTLSYVFLTIFLYIQLKRKISFIKFPVPKFIYFTIIGISIIYLSSYCNFFSTSNLLNLIIFLILSLTIYAILTLPFLVKIIKEFFLILKQ